MLSKSDKILAKLKKAIIVGSLGLIILCLVIVWQWPDENLHAIFCDVGQGDAILITQGFFQVLVDGGPSEEKVLACLQNNLPFWDRSLELIVITHADADHIGGLDQVLADYQVQQVLISDAKASKEFKNLQKALQQEARSSMQLNEAKNGQLINFPSGGELKVLWPRDGFFTAEIAQKTQFSETILSDEIAVLADLTNVEFDHNDRSIVLLLSYGQWDLLLTGDIDQEIELALVVQNLIGDVDVLKIAHHGANTSSSLSFLQVVQPEIGVISCGKNNQYNHPAQEVLQNLTAINAKILRTDENGEIELVTDGQNYWQH